MDTPNDDEILGPNDPLYSIKVENTPLPAETHPAQDSTQIPAIDAVQREETIITPNKMADETTKPKTETKTETETPAPAKPKKEVKTETPTAVVKKDYTILIGCILALLVAAALYYIQNMKKRKDGEDTFDTHHEDMTGDASQNGQMSQEDYFRANQNAQNELFR